MQSQQISPAALGVPTAVSRLVVLRISRTSVGARSSGVSAGPSSSGRGAMGSGSAANAGGQLWVEKHKPTNSSELVGNGTLVSTLRTFLTDW